MNQSLRMTPKLRPVDKTDRLPRSGDERSAKSIAEALGGRRTGECWMAKCPAHVDRTPSLSIRDSDGTVLVRCHAGCVQEDVLAALRSRGLWPANGVACANSGVRCRREAALDAAASATARTEMALRIWDQSTVAAGSLVHRYLHHRGIDQRIPESIRFHRGLKHASGVVLPAMVALVTHGGNGSPLAVHRTFLASDGRQKATVDPNRMMLGPCRGGGVRLSEVTTKVMVGEGIETCLAAMQVAGLPAWAALSTSGLCTLDLPETVEDVVVLADGDVAGEHAARQAAARWTRHGRRVRIARPPWGCDFNDVLMGRAPAQEVRP